MGPLKIGKAAHIPSRIKNLQIGCPFPLYLFAEGELSKKGRYFYANSRMWQENPKRISFGYSREEQETHAVFRHWRVRGEWFDIAVLDFMMMVEGNTRCDRIEWRLKLWRS